MPTYPQTGTLALPVLPFGGGAPLITPNLSYTLWEMNLEVAMPAVAVPLPAGTWNVEVIVTSTPANLAPPAATYSSGSTVLASTGTVTTGALNWRGYRNIDGTTQTVYAQITVMQNVAGTWKQYASTLATATPPTLSLAPPDPYVVANLPRYGSNTNVTVVGSGPWTPTTDQPGSLHKYFDGMAAIGMNIVRCGIPWEVLCFSGSAFDPTWQSLLDDIFSYADNKGLKVYTDFGLCAPPTWAGTGATLSSNRQAFLSQALNRWGTHFVAMSVNNEPNAGSSPPVVPVASFVAATQDCFTACRAYNAALPVVAGDLAWGDTTYLTQAYASGLGGNFDGVGIHPYNTRIPASGQTFPGDPAIPQAETPQTAINPVDGASHSLVGGCAIIHEVMSNNGDAAKKIWVSEYGWNTSGVPGAASINYVDESAQASYLAFAFRQAARIPYLAAVMQYRGYDVVNPANPGYEAWATYSRWGFMRDDATHKPSYAAMQTAITNLKAGTG